MNIFMFNFGLCGVRNMIYTWYVYRLGVNLCLSVYFFCSLVDRLYKVKKKILKIV